MPQRGSGWGTAHIFFVCHTQRVQIGECAELRVLDSIVLMNSTMAYRLHFKILCHKLFMHETEKHSVKNAEIILHVLR